MEQKKTLSIDDPVAALVEVVMIMGTNGMTCFWQG